MKTGIKQFVCDIFFTAGKLRNKLFLTILAVALLPLLTFSFLAFYTINLSHQYDVATIEDGVIFQKATEAENLIEETLNKFEFYFNLPVQNLIAVETEESRGKKFLYKILKTDLDNILSKILSENSFVEEVSFIDAENALEIAKKSRYPDNENLFTDLSGVDYFKKAVTGERYVSDVFFTLTGPMIIVASPVKNNANRTVGILYGLVNLSVIQKIVRETHFGNAGYIYLVNKEGRLIANSRIDAPIPPANLSKNEMASDVILGIDHTGIKGQKRYQSFWNEEVIGAGKKLSSLEFSLIAEWPVEDADSFLNAISFQALIFAFGGAILIFIISIFISRKIVRPIEILKKGTERVAKGNFDEPISVITHDEMENIAASFNEMLKGLKEFQALKDEFVFIASHELRTPVTAIRGYLSMIEEGDAGEIPPKIKEYLKPVSESTLRLVNLVNDLLEVARNEAGRLTIRVAKMDPAPAIKSVMEELKPLAQEKEIFVSYDDFRSKAVLADDARLKEIMVNLLSNAIKYTVGSGRVTIWHDIRDNMLVTHVKDTGIGIPLEAQKKLFEKFYRVQDEKTRDVKGTGLGLFIVKQIVEKMKGKIWFESKEGEGTTFSFSLPLAGL